MGFLAVGWKCTLSEVRHNRVHPIGFEVDAHDMVELGISARSREVLYLDDAFHF